MKHLHSPSVLVLAFGLALPAHATKLLAVRTADERHLMIQWADQTVVYKDDGQGPGAFQGHESQGGDQFIPHGKPLDVPAATTPSSYRITSPDDPNFRQAVTPEKVFRKTKVSGTAWKWPDPDLSYEHTLFLRLPKNLKSGKRYEISISAATGTDVTRRQITFEVTKSESEAIHVNLIGYDSGQSAMKSADLYLWMGDGGARNYADVAGRGVSLVDVKSGKRHPVGQVKFWKKSGPDYANWNLTRSDVWTCDFSAFRQPGRYRLVVDGVGCSPAFDIRPDAYFEPMKTSVRGFYYMRIGEPKEFRFGPPPRQPQFIQGKDPANFKVYLTTFGPWHPEWNKKPGDPWDQVDWSAYKELGEPTNPQAYGGHSDACDWDRHIGHISIIWDLLLPYFLTNGRLGEDNLGIAESGNGIPDLLDEARNEVDFWLRLRDREGGYSTGLNNPPKEHNTLYQAAARPYAAWASACNAAMLGDAFRLAKKPDLATKYRDAALEAWRIADERDLDESYSIGNGRTRGRDLKMMAAAYLYNLTGDRKFEDAMAKESVITGPESNSELEDKHNQLWGIAGYLMAAQFSWRPTHHPELLANMRASILREATEKNVANTEKWPSRRSSDNAYGWFQTIQEVQRVCVAHAIAPTSDKAPYLRALILEADYGLGRNPMNMVQMTGLGSRHADDIYTTGRNDGVPGVHPGHTPYMNSEPWGEGFMADPKYYARRGYPAWEQWPQGEALWRARYCYSNNEFTPQQSMRGKMCLLAYLYGIRSGRGN